MQFDDLSHIQLAWAGFDSLAELRSPLTLRRLHFLTSYLVNSVHGPLYEEIRLKRGWSYSMRRRSHLDLFGNYHWEFDIDLHTAEQALQLRDELPDLIWSALHDSARIEQETERILGVGIVGSGAGELISEGVLAIEMGATVRDLAESVHPHPTLSETIMEAAEFYYGHSAHAFTKRTPSLQTTSS
jgi:hypothetical protein